MSSQYPASFNHAEQMPGLPNIFLDSSKQWLAWIRHSSTVTRSGTVPCTRLGAPMLILATVGFDSAHMHVSGQRCTLNFGNDLTPHSASAREVVDGRGSCSMVVTPCPRRAGAETPRDRPWVVTRSGWNGFAVQHVAAATEPTQAAMTGLSAPPQPAEPSDAANHHGGANGEDVRRVFRAHGVALGSPPPC